MTNSRINRSRWALCLTFVLLIIGLGVAVAAAQDSTPLPQVQVIINPPVIAVGDTVTVSVQVQNMTNLYGLQANCAVDPAVLTGVGRVDGDVFNQANSFFVDNGMKADGSWLIAATLLQPAPAFTGTGTVFHFQYQAQAAGSSSVMCSVLASNPFSAVIPVEVQGSGLITVNPVAAVETVVPVPTVESPLPTEIPTEVVVEPQPTITETPSDEIQPTETGIPEVEPTVTVEGEIIPPTEEAPLGTTPSSIMGSVVYPIGADQSGINVFLTADGNLIGQAVTGADGHYQFNDVTPGSYVLLVNAVEHLSLSYTITVIGDGAPIDVGQATLVAGDTDGNQVIDLADSSLITANFDQPSPPAPGNADLNHDGQINVADLVLIGMNYGQTGPVVIQ
ncbi:MAG: carboxypeptidase regulatory-like domain-containing protein [Anaerolineae bacterium]